MASNPTSSWQTAAQTRLRKLGFNPLRKCVLLSDVCDKLLVRIPYIPRRIEVFPCMDYRDKMHGLFIFLHKIVMGGMNQMKWSTIRGVNARQLLDLRMACLGSSKVFRNLGDGRALRTQRSLFSDANMSATDKMCWLFTLPHVLGHRAEAIRPDLRMPMLNAIARAQLMVIAARGRRQFTIPELRQIFDEGYVELFRAMEYIHSVAEENKFRKATNKYNKDPVKNPPPKRFKSKRYP